ncbi:MAG TPA: alpha/beta fold hydrolase [Hyphomicrobiaceae bacterium]|nr:alpha/beta fold hydrolase [Hyphomicrobiaceae bacterium]
MSGTFHVKMSGRPDIRYRVEGSGPAVTLVHGVGASLDSWDEVAAHMQARYRIVRMDLAGHGKSGPIRGERSLQDFADDVRVVWDHLGLATTHLAGFSLGGLIAQSLALSDPGRIDRLAILSAVAGRTAEERAKVVGRLALLKEGGIPAVTAAAEERWFTPEFRQRHPERVAQRMRELLANDPVSYASAYTVFATSDLGDRVGDIRHPTLVATGEHDVGSNVRMARMMHAAIAGSQLCILPGLRHSVLVEAPRQVADMLLRFFDLGKAQDKA